MDKSVGKIFALDLILVFADQKANKIFVRVDHITRKLPVWFALNKRNTASCCQLLGWFFTKVQKKNQERIDAAGEGSSLSWQNWQNSKQVEASEVSFFLLSLPEELSKEKSIIFVFFPFMFLIFSSFCKLSFLPSISFLILINFSPDCHYLKNIQKWKHSSFYFSHSCSSSFLVSTNSFFLQSSLCFSFFSLQFPSFCFWNSFFPCNHYPRPCKGEKGWIFRSFGTQFGSLTWNRQYWNFIELQYLLVAQVLTAILIKFHPNLSFLYSKSTTVELSFLKEFWLAHHE